LRKRKPLSKEGGFFLCERAAVFPDEHCSAYATAENKLENFCCCAEQGFARDDEKKKYDGAYAARLPNL